MAAAIRQAAIGDGEGSNLNRIARVLTQPHKTRISLRGS